MKTWHWGLVLAILAGYLLGVFFPGPGSALRAKVGV